MTQVNAATGRTNSATQATGKNALNDLDLDVFLDLMIAELQNQDPLNPLDNAQLLQQISQIREVGATDRLSSTLDSVLLGQNISSATNLIGAEVTALTDGGERVQGNVRRVTIDNGEPKLDLALETVVDKGTVDGEVDEGVYKYEVVWESQKGEKFGIEMEANTGQMSDFKGSIRLGNLPETDTLKRVYRTDHTGSGERKLVGVIGSGKSTSFVDVTADSDRQEVLTGERQRLTYARKVTVKLSNIAEVQPPE